MDGDQSPQERIKVKVFRFDPSKDERPYYSDFVLSREKVRRLSGSKTTVLDVLKYLKANYDEGLSFYASCLIPFYEAKKMGRCDRGICNVFLNGKPVLTCEEDIGNSEELLIEPPSIDPSLAFEVIKDLIAKDVTIREKDYFFIVRKKLFNVLSELAKEKT